MKTNINMDKIRADFARIDNILAEANQRTIRWNAESKERAEHIAALTAEADTILAKLGLPLIGQ